ncbi:uncharacterized protein TRAVEDRAFT_24584 [Trametes versicolor FP-101664 SS1]|uniref:uncharacterized protein n=1 Tax=Trametes versicolor (strain FP-101664) TaxID=717944 RepID=UPI00046245A4|nr:uncharacterized protein TRAVEDRAFT_24584 [Trametes versicolor FP-101664 SS1]EIW52364.1 hypothetical protein TRAVEDRAFT_24584 [Trametes versicolor FP-101664 SS1]
MPEAILGGTDTVILSSKCPAAHFGQVTGYEHLCESPCNTTDVDLNEQDATHPDPRMFLRQMSEPAALYNVGDGDRVFWFRDWGRIDATEVRSLADPDMDIPEEARAIAPTLKLGVATRTHWDWERYRCGTRPYLTSRLAWALVRHSMHPAYIVQRWEDWAHAGVALRFRHSIPQHVWTNLTRLKLQLDDVRPGDPHGHAIYTTVGLDGHARHPNWWTMCEIVGLCAYLGARLVGLSVSMCFPELVVLHVPRFVHAIVQRCPKLLYLGVEDTQCQHFLPHVFPGFGYLAAAVRADRPSDEKIVTPEGQLHTLVLAKASIVCWEAEYQDEDLAQEFEERLEEAESLPYRIERAPALWNASMKAEEARDLARLMVQEIPSLRRAYVALDRGALDLRADKDGVFQTVSAGDAYMIE